MKSEIKCSFPPIAIVAAEALFPGQPGKGGFWQDIVGGEDNITEIPPGHWLIEDYYDPDPSVPDKTYCKTGGFIPTVPFDPLEFGVPPSTLQSTDTAQLLALLVAKRLLQELGETQSVAVDKEQVSVILGTAATTELTCQMSNRLQAPIWVKALRQSGLPEEEVQAIRQRIADHYVPWQESSFPGMLGNVIAGRIANRLDLGGSNFVTDAACASSLAAIRSALDELHLGHSDAVITGGVDALNDILMYLCFSKTPAFSPSGKCRPFSDKADGTIISEGVGMFVLRRLEDAERDGNVIYAVIRGMGSASDGKATSVYAPRAGGQALAIERAYAGAGFGPETVGLVEAHGTGTVAGDAAEFEGLNAVFAPSAPDRKQWCALGSIKSQVGHAKGAAGAAGLFKIVMALHHGVVPPTIQIERPNPKFKIEESPFYLGTEAKPWIAGAGSPRRASVSSFGFGGSNFHLLAEEYTGPGRRPGRLRAFADELFLFSAGNRGELVEQLRGYRVAGAKPSFAQIAAGSRTKFQRTAMFRLSIVAESWNEFSERAGQVVDLLEQGQNQKISKIPGVAFSDNAAKPGRVAFVFPGQGSQYLNMGSGLAVEFEEARRPWDQAASLPGLEQLPATVFPVTAFDDATRARQEVALVSTANAQPAIALMSQGICALLGNLGIRPDMTLGHSFGEVTALQSAGVFQPGDLAAIARRRGESMARVSEGNPGAMIAVGLERTEAERLIRESGTGLVVANDNSPSQVILSGTTVDVEAFVQLLERKGRTSTRLAVATAFHSAIVAEAARPFGEFLGTLKLSAPGIPVIANSTAEPYPAEPAAICELLAGQLAKPVRFRDSIERLHAEGVRTFVEVGPGSVLTGLIRQCLGSREHSAIALDRKNNRGISVFLEGIGQLAVAGVELDAAALWRQHASPDPRWTEAPSHAVFINGANVGRKYPPAGGSAAIPKPNPPAAQKPIAAKSQMEPSKPSHPSPDLQALEAFHRHAAETHREFQRLMAESHQTYLRTIASLAGGTPLPPPAPHSNGSSHASPAHSHPAEPAPWATPPAWSAPAPRATTPPPPAPAAAMPPAPLLSQRPSPSSSPAPAPAAAAPVAAPVAASAKNGAAHHDPVALLLSVVAESTGYPVEMLNLDMELEAGLGVDSIKQVEILSALQNKLPGLPEIKPSQLAQMRTLGQIAAHLRANLPGASPDAKAPSATHPSASSPENSDGDLKKKSLT